jgi:F0F1-type ATP synthase membrane subunit a
MVIQRMVVRFFQSQRRFLDLNRVFFNDFVICRLARTYSKNGGIATGGGRIFEPVVLFIRDEIAIPNIGEKHYKKYMSYLLYIFLCVILKYFGLMPFGINVTGNLTITFALAVMTFLITNLTANKTIGVIFSGCQSAKIDAYRIGTN